MTGVVVEHDGERETARATWSSSPAARPTAPGCCCLGDRRASGRARQRLRTRSGRNYMFHNSQAVLALSEEPNPTVFQKTLGLNDFYFGGRDFDYPLGNIQMVGKSSADMYRGEKPLQTRLAPQRTLEEVARHAVDFWLSTEDLPRAGEPCHAARRRPHPAALHAEQRGAEGAAAARAQVAARVPRDAAAPPAAAARLPQERDPRRGLRAPGRDVPVRHRSRDVGARHHCRAHEVDNLYVVDTSFFPSIGAVNPALTAMANALRVGDHLLERLGARETRREPQHVA